MTARVKTTAASYKPATFSVASIIRFNQACIEFRKFKAMVPDQMKDPGIDAAYVDSVTFQDFR